MPVLSIPPSGSAAHLRRLASTASGANLSSPRGTITSCVLSSMSVMPRTDSRSDSRNSSVNGLTPKYRIYSSTVPSVSFSRTYASSPVRSGFSL